MKNKRDKRGTKNTKILPKIRKFKFEIKPSRLSKNAREIIELEDVLYPLIKAEKGAFLKSVHRGTYDDNVLSGCLYWDKMLKLDDCLQSNLSNYLQDWYVDSRVLSYINDCASINTPPDYSMKSIKENYEYSVDILLDMLVEYSSDIGMKRINKVKYKSICEWFIVYLNRAYNSNSLALRYTRDENFKSSYGVDNSDFSYTILIRLMDMLVERGLGISYTGNTLYGVRPMSMFVYNPSLLDVLLIRDANLLEFTTLVKEPVVVRNSVDGSKRKVNIPLKTLDTEYQSLITESTQVLNNYHNCLNSHEVAIDGFKVPELGFQRVLSIKKGECGRLFDNGSIQGKSKSVREMITIDGIATDSLDYKAIHPAILLSWEGYSLQDHDPYPKLDSIQVDVKLISRFTKYYGIQGYDPVRNIVKKLFLCMINASDLNKAVGSCYKELGQDNLKKGNNQEHTMKFVGLPTINLHDVAKEILKHNSMIAKYLGVGVGNKLQYIDSCIIMNCLEELTNKGIPCIPVHDALICKQSDSDVGYQVMTESFIKVVGKNADNNCIIEKE